MRTEIKLEAAYGKILEGVEFSSCNHQAVLTFTDGTFTTFDIDRGYDSSDATITPGVLDLADFGNDSLVRIGVATNEELMQLGEERTRKFIEGAEKRELELYERLQKKFGSRA